MWANLTTALLLAIPAQAAPGEPSAEVLIAKTDRERSAVQIAIINTSDRPLCLQQGHGVRSFNLSRNGRPVPWAPGIPFISVRDRCQVIEPGEVLHEDYDLAIAYPNLRRDDRLCFTARLWFKGDQEITTPTIACRLVD